MAFQKITFPTRQEIARVIGEDLVLAFPRQKDRRFIEMLWHQTFQNE